MSKNNITDINSEETIKAYVKAPVADEAKQKKKKNKYQKRTKKDDKESDKSGVSNIQRALIPINRLRQSFRNLNCFKSQTDEELPMMEVPRHKSIDIGVGLARRMSLFLFTRRTVCVHPYHPFTPAQTTRKIHVFHDEKPSK